MFHALYFVRNSGEYRNVCIKDDHYRITGMNGGMGKAHPSSEFGKYYQQIIAKGWRKVTQQQYLESRWMRRQNNNDDEFICRNDNSTGKQQVFSNRAGTQRKLCLD